MAKFEAKISIATDGRFTEVHRADQVTAEVAVAKALATLADAWRSPKLSAIADAAWKIATTPGEVSGV